MSDRSVHFHPPPSEGIWHSLNRFLLTVIALAALVPIGVSFLPEIKKRKEAQSRIEELTAQVDNQRMLLVRLQREESLLKHDPEYVSLVARDRLDLMKEGETIYRLDSARPDPVKARAIR